MNKTHFMNDSCRSSGKNRQLMEGGNDRKRLESPRDNPPETQTSWVAPRLFSRPPLLLLRYQFQINNNPHF